MRLLLICPLFLCFFTLVFSGKTDLDQVAALIKEVDPLDLKYINSWQSVTMVRRHILNGEVVAHAIIYQQGELRAARIVPVKKDESGGSYFDSKNPDYIAHFTSDRYNIFANSREIYEALKSIHYGWERQGYGPEQYTYNAH